MKRQRIRRAILLVSTLLFPITLNYFSPYLVVNGSFQGVLTGSALLFIGQFLSALFFGRAFCGWICPGGGLQELCTGIQPKSTGRMQNRVKYLLWFPWLGAIIAGFVSAGGLNRIDVLYMTDHGISVSAPANYVVYFGVVTLMVGLALGLGRRGACHSICWMAPFMVIGSWLREKLQLPGLRLSAADEGCIGCGICTNACPMSLPVDEMVKTRNFVDSECILCASCADACPKSVLRLSFRKTGSVGSQKSRAASARCTKG